MSSASAPPDPEAEPVLETAPQARTGRNIPRSCHICNRRKVRCDKKEPCSQCTRAGRECMYPSSGRVTRRPKKTIMADMAARICSLEKTLARAADASDFHGSIPRAPVSMSAHSLPGEQPIKATGCGRRGTKEGVLVQKGSSSQYFNEIILSRVIEEEQDVRSVLTTPDSTPLQPAVSSPFNPVGILSAVSSSQLPCSFHPPRLLAHRLWNLYVENVEACPGLKVLHLPTDEVRVYTTINQPEAASPDNLSLCFAIYYASLISLSNDEAEAILGNDKLRSLARFKAGLEQAFAHADFLDSPTVTGLHAMAIYMSALRVHNRGKGIWILNGLAIRIAQSLGVHRDGERLGLSPFQSEIRRRLWWHFIGRDGYAGEIYGLQNTSSLFQMSDITMPLNVEDADLYPDMKELPTPRKGWTSMTSSIIDVDISKALHRLAVYVSTSTPSNPPREDVRAQIVGETRARIEERLQYCNSVIPRHRLTMNISRFIVRKLELVTRQQWQLLRCPRVYDSFATEENLVEALETLELGLTPMKDMPKSYVWSARAYPQYHLALYILWHLCVKPEGPNTERAWEAIDGVYLGELRDGVIDGHGPKAMVLRAVKTKAEAVREQVRKSKSAAELRGRDGDPSPVEREGQPSDGGPWDYSLGHMSRDDGFDLSINGVAFPAWETLVQEFQLDGENFLNVFWQ